MKIKTRCIRNNGSEIHLLMYGEFNPSNYLSKLTSIEIEKLKTFGSITRKREFVAVRILRDSLFGLEPILYNSLGAPYINKKGFVSISHSKNMVGFAFNSEHPIGLDLEYPQEKIHKIQSKFISDTERQLFDTNDRKVLTQLWSAKEAMYKLAGRKKIIFNSELLLAPSSENKLRGTIINLDHQLKVNLDIFEFENTIITINSKPVERIESNSQSN